jgi:hypothetical protein
MDLVKTRSNTQEYANKVSNFQSFTDVIAERYPYDDQNPRALVNLMSVTLKKLYDSNEVQTYIAKGEEELEKLCDPDVTIKRVRLSLWNWYSTIHDRMQWRDNDTSDNLISAERICLGVCNPIIWYKRIQTDPIVLAYIFTCPASYEVMVQEALSESMNRLRDILKFPLYDQKYNKEGELICRNGMPVEKPNIKAAELMLKVAAFLDLRVNGAIPKVIKQDVRSVSVHQHNNVGGASNDFINHTDLGNTLLNMEEIDTQLDKLRKQTEDLIRYPSFTNKEKDTILVDSDNGRS